MRPREIGALLRSFLRGDESIEAKAGAEWLAEWMDDIRRGSGKIAPTPPRDEDEEPEAQADEDEDELTEDEEPDDDDG